MKPTNAGRSIENVIQRAIQARASGRWPSWRHHNQWPLPARGWLADVRKVVENGVFAILIRDVDAPPIGIVTHAAISTVGNVTDITWAERQRIKNEVFGLERTAVEVMPPESELVDGANMYHLWVLPVGYLLPFSLATRERIKP